MDNQLPVGWRKLGKGGRPGYRRRDGYRVILDHPGIWGARRPREERPFAQFGHQYVAMRWLNDEEPAHG